MIAASLLCTADDILYECEVWATETMRTMHPTVMDMMLAAGGTPIMGKAHFQAIYYGYAQTVYKEGKYLLQVWVAPHWVGLEGYCVIPVWGPRDLFSWQISKEEADRVYSTPLRRVR